MSFGPSVLSTKNLDVSERGIQGSLLRVVGVCLTEHLLDQWLRTTEFVQKTKFLLTSVYETVS